MKFSLYIAVVVAAIREPQSPYVLDYFDKLDADCTRESCVPQLTACADGSDKDCLQRVECLHEASGEEGYSSCLRDKDQHRMTWSELDNTEVKVLDCAHPNKCMPDERE